MRKRKTNPSLKVAGGSRDPKLSLEENAILEEHAVVATLTQPIGSVANTRVPAIGRLANAVDVATEGTIVLPRTEGAAKETVQPVVTGTGILGEPNRPLPEQSLANQLQEEEADVAGYNVADPHWFWEMLAEAGYDVW